MFSDQVRVIVCTVNLGKGDYEQNHATFSSSETLCQEGFEVFGVNEHVERWLAQVADVEPRAGGKHGLFWNPKDKI